MKLKLKDVIAMHAAMLGTATMPGFAKLPLNALLSYRVKEIFDVVKEKAANYKQANYDLCVRLGVEVEGQPGTYTVLPENMDQFTKEMNEMADGEVELPDYKIPFKAIEKLNVSAEVLDGVMPILSELPD